MNIAIIGAGPVGCYAGYLLSKEGYDVTIYETHKEVGLPIQCTGILTNTFDQFNIDLSSSLVNTITKHTVYSKKNTLSIKQKDYVVCRKRFDQSIAQLAKEAGATIKTSHTFLRKEKGNLIIKNTLNNKEISISPDVVIGADGPLSPTAKAYDFYHKGRSHFFGMQAIVEGNFNKEEIQTYFGEQVCPGLFAWIVPESTTKARVGLATQKKTKYYFDQFLKKHNLHPISVQAGTIPLYHFKQKLQKGNCYLVGDASGFVKATTLGGIVPAFKQVQILVDCIKNNKDYSKEVKHLRREMWLHLKVHHIIKKFTNNDFDKLLKYTSQEKVQTIFQKYTRDTPIPLVTRTLLKEPRYLRFLKHLF